MLPGFRILIACVVLSASVLIFGLGAAALLRSAHEEFASLPSWREAQKPIQQFPNPQFPASAQIKETRPVLAMLKIEPTVSTPTDIKLPDPPKIASATTGVATDGAVGAQIDNTQPEKPRVRRAKRSRLAASTRRQRAISRNRAARAAQAVQFQQNSDPFRLFPTPSNNGG